MPIGTLGKMKKLVIEAACLTQSNIIKINCKPVVGGMIPEVLSQFFIFFKVKQFFSMEILLVYLIVQEN